MPHIRVAIVTLTSWVPHSREKFSKSPCATSSEQGFNTYPLNGMTDHLNSTVYSYNVSGMHGNYPKIDSKWLFWFQCRCVARMRWTKSSLLWSNPISRFPVHIIDKLDRNNYITGSNSMNLLVHVIWMKEEGEVFKDAAGGVGCGLDDSQNFHKNESSLIL